jgi:magnesium-transporting ATPase (P-type)
MGKESSEAARGAADLIIADAELATLGASIVEGRAVWDSVRDAVSVLVGGNLGEIGFTLIGGLLSGRPPLSPRQLLLVNVFTDVAPATALAVRPPRESELSAVAGRSPDLSMGSQLTRDIYSRAIITASGAGLAWGLASLIGDRRGASTTALLALVGTQLGQTYQSGRHVRQVVVTTLATAAGLLILVQTPGISQTFGCRPVGPLGLSIAAGSSVLATVVGKRVPGWLELFLPPAEADEFDGGEFEDAPALSRRPSLLPQPV